MAKTNKLSHKESSGKQDQTTLVLKAVSKKYEQLKDWSANFIHETLSTGLGSGTYNKGYFHFVAPNKFFFSLNDTEHSDFVSDGTQAWFIQYPQGRDKPALVKHFRQLKNLELNKYLLLLKGIRGGTPNERKALEQEFHIDGRILGEKLILELVPRTAKDIAKVTLEFNNHSIAPEKATIEDSIGSQISISITKWEKISADKIKPQWFMPKYPAKSNVEQL